MAASQLPISIRDNDDLVRLVKSYMKGCSTHEACKTAMSGKQLDDELGVELPTRLLSIKPQSDPDSICLVDTGGTVGRYSALSYAWGPAHLNPPMTTLVNYSERKDHISLSNLPQVFRDAVWMSREVGIDYIWIDSLCILQDSTDDWEMESQKMGQVFENAFLVIAAAGARDPNYSMFDIYRFPELCVEVPLERDGSNPGTMRITMQSHHTDDPGWGPLRERGWTFQEWQLARRMLSFMPGGASWRCKTLEAREHEAPFHSSNWAGADDFNMSNITPLSSGKTYRWLAFLRQYSAAKLTKETDRLPSIQGLANEIQKIRPGEYCKGFFIDDLAKQLIWSGYRCGQTPYVKRSRLSVPSWCWASLDGKVSNLGMFVTSEVQFEDSTDITRVSIHENGLMILARGTMYLSKCVEHMGLRRDIGPRDENCSEVRFFEAAAWDGFSLGVKDSMPATWGIGVFDQDPGQVESVFALPLVSTLRRLEDQRWGFARTLVLIWDSLTNTIAVVPDWGHPIRQFNRM